MAMPEVLATVSPSENLAYASYRSAAMQASPGLRLVKKQFRLQGTCPLDQLIQLCRCQLEFSGINPFVEKAGLLQQFTGKRIPLQEQFFDFLNAALEAYRLDDFAMYNHTAYRNGCRVRRLGQLSKWRMTL